MQKSNSVAEVEYIDKSENASPTDGTEQQRRKSDQELDLTAPPQASVDDSSCNSETPELSWSAFADEVVRQNLVSMESEINMASSFPAYQQSAAVSSCNHQWCSLSHTLGPHSCMVLCCILSSS